MGKRETCQGKILIPKRKFLHNVFYVNVFFVVCVLILTSVWDFLCLLTLQCLELFCFLKLWYSLYSLQSFTALLICYVLMEQANSIKTSSIKTILIEQANICSDYLRMIF